MSEVLNPIERRIYNYLVEYLKRETYQPSIREIGSRFGIRSTKTVTEHLQSLQRKGYLDRMPSRSRALRILGLNLSPDTYTIPLYGNARGSSDDVEARYDLDRALACSADCFLVRVEGNRLAERGILDGDMILVEPSEGFVESEPVVFERDGTVELQLPEEGNRAGNGIPASAHVLGVARAVLRRFRGNS